jgi:hypothetical protein
MNWIGLDDSVSRKLQLQGSTRRMQWTRRSCSGGGDLTVAVEVDVHHGCRVREARLVVELAAAGGGVERWRRGVEWDTRSYKGGKP